MARPNPGPDMQRLAEDFVRSMRDFDWELDYSEQSIRMLEEITIGSSQIGDRGEAARLRRRTFRLPLSSAPTSGK